jgi:DNA repair and recombination RAD54-like protein
MDLEDNDGAAEEGQEQEEDEWEVEEEEEEDDEDTEEEEGSEEESEAEAEPHRGAPSNARAASVTEVFLKRKFEGWLIARVADTATAADSTVAARTRSRRRCPAPSRKLLKRGTCSKPYCVDTASEESAWESEEEDRPPRAPALSSSDERELDGGAGGTHRRAVIGKRQRRGKNPAKGDSDSEEYGGGQEMARRRYVKNNAADGDGKEPGGGGGEDRETAARRRGKQPAHGHGDDDESDEDRPPRKPKRGAASCAFKNKGVLDGFDQHQHDDDVVFKKSSLIFPRGRVRRERETYDDLLDTIFEGIEDFQNGSAPYDVSVPPTQGQGYDTLPLVFSAFEEDEDEVVVEKTDHEKKVDELFGDWDALLEEQSTDAPADAREKVTNSRKITSENMVSLIMVLLNQIYPVPWEEVFPDKTSSLLNSLFHPFKFQTEPFSN